MIRLIKILLSIVTICACTFSFAQPIINRAGASNTVSDARWQAQYNLLAPRYTDTTAANLQIGIDSCGALIYTRSPQTYWRRDCSPKRWTRVSDLVAVSQGDTSKYFLTKPYADTLAISGTKIRNIQQQGYVSQYQMPVANLTNQYDAFTTGGAMASATITQVGGYDNISVGGSDQNSYFYPTDKLFSGRPLYGHLKVKVGTLGATPLLGFRTIVAPGQYVSFSHNQGYFYVNLITGVITFSFGGYTPTATNNFSGSVSAGEVIDLYFTWIYNSQVLMTVVRNNLNGETSQVSSTFLVNGNGNAMLIRLAAIMAGGEYQLIKYEVGINSFLRPKVVLAGDSELSGICITAAATIRNQLLGLIPYNVMDMSATASLLTGIQAVQSDIINLNPEVVVFDNIIDALWFNYSDPASPNYASWSAAFNKYVNAYIRAGIEPVLFVPSITFLYPDSRCTTLINYWTTNFPGRQYVQRLATDGGFDCTGFHLNAAANLIVARNIITVLNALNKL